ncbi:hypothetical protein ACWDPP_31220, partial [Streptomyces sp. NPDC000851]
DIADEELVPAPRAPHGGRGTRDPGQRLQRGVRLVSCAGRHDEQVLGFTRLDAGLTLAQARTRSDTACARDVPPADYGFDPSVYEAGSWTSEGSWKSGTHFVVCTVRKQNGGTMEGDEP